MNVQHKKGLDEFYLEADFAFFLQTALQNGWELFDVTKKEEEIHFYAAFRFRNQILSAYPNIEWRRTTGLFGFFQRNIKNPYRILSLCLSLGLWYILSNTIFEVKIIGEKQETRTQIQSKMEELGIHLPMVQLQEEQLKQQLKKSLENEIAWLETKQTGSLLNIYYTPKEYANKEKLTRNALYAQKDGVIAYFDLQHGNKEVQVHQLVHKGDLLVSNILLDSKQKEEEIYVKGRVFAYTYETVEVVVEEGTTKDPFLFFRCLLQARDQISEHLKEKDRIIEENILQFEEELGKIKMVLQYQLLEDISTP